MKRIPVLPVAAACAIVLGVSSTTVLAAEERNDTWSEAALTTTYTLNRHLNPFDIDVEVQDGIAILSGTVESDVERDLAEELAMGVEGVNKVENHLKVEPGMETREDAGDDFMTMVNDANITAKVKSQLLWNNNTHGLQIDVDTENSVVTLKGEVTSSAEADLAEQIAHNTTDVKAVHNRLVVSGNASLGSKVERQAREVQQEMSDAWITTKVKSALLYNSSIDGNDIDVDTRKGVVHLKGTVDSERQKQSAVSVANDIRGVKEVRESLQIGGRS